jgi:hypothetical protein
VLVDRLTALQSGDAPGDAAQQAPPRRARRPRAARVAAPDDLLPVRDRFATARPLYGGD